MSAVVAKSVEISEEAAQRLKELAKARGTSENVLIEEGLDLLFREQHRRIQSTEALRDDYNELALLEAELGPLPPSIVAPVQWKGASIVASTPVPTNRLRRIEDAR